MFNSHSRNPRKSVARALLLTLTIAGAAGCTPKAELGNDPKTVVNEYISKSFQIKAPSEKEALLGYLTKEAKSRLAAWSDDQFREAFIENKREFLTLAFKESKPVSPDEVNVTYELSYLDHAKGHDAKVTQKKLAQVVREQGRWMISDVQNIKELVEYRNEMSLP